MKAQAMELRAQGKTLHEVAAALGITVSKTWRLTSPKYQPARKGRDGKTLREIAHATGVSISTAWRRLNKTKRVYPPPKCTAAECRFPAHGVRRLGRARYVCACCHRDQSLASVFCWEASSGKLPKVVA